MTRSSISSVSKKASAWLGIDEDLEAVLAGVAGAGDHQLGFAPGERGVVHEAELGRLGDDGAHHVDGFGALQRQQRAMVGAVERRLAGRGIGDAVEIGVLGAGVDDDVERPAPAFGGGPGDHQVVMGAAGVVEQQGVANLAGLQAPDVAAAERLDQRGDGGMIGLAIAGLLVEDEKARAHVGDVEQTGMLAASTCARR